MKKFLCIGNSFGTDGARYLHGVARAAGVDTKVVNLYIGGCSLYRHYRNMLSGEKAYSYEINGFSSGLCVSLKEALLSDEWDAIYTQQCSPDSGEPETYEPFASRLAAFVRECCPHAKFFVQETWTFETDAPRFLKTSYRTPETHIEAIRECYKKMAEITEADGIIPCGDAMYALWQRKAELGIDAVHRDGFHAHFGHGRYLLALTIFSALTGRDVRENTFCDFDTEVDPKVAQACREIAYEVTHKA